MSSSGRSNVPLVFAGGIGESGARGQKRRVTVKASRLGLGIDNALNRGGGGRQGMTSVCRDGWAKISDGAGVH